MRRWQAILLSFVLPPIGVFISLFRPFPAGAGIIGKFFRTLGRAVMAGGFAILTLVYLVKAGVLYVEMSGAGFVPIFSTRNPKTDEEALEKHRAAHHGAPADAATAALPAVAPAAVQAAAAPATTETAGTKAGETPAIPAAAPAPAPAPPWSEFRGVGRDGVYREGPILTTWPAEGLKAIWKQPIGGGYASFVVANGVAFTIEQRREKEVVAAYDVNTGREIWTHGWNARFSESMGGDGPRATPTWHDGLLYALGATLYALWSRPGKGPYGSGPLAVAVSSRSSNAFAWASASGVISPPLRP